MADTEAERLANQKALKDLQDGAQDDDDGEVIELSEDDDEGAEPGQPQGSVRKEKKQARFKEFEERASRAESEAAELRARLAAQDEIRKAMPAQPAGEQKDPVKEKISALRAKQHRLATDFDSMTPEGKRARQESVRQEYQDLETEIATTIAEAAAAKHAPAQGGPTAEQAARTAALRVRYEDVVNHKNANEIIDWAGGRWKGLIARAKATGSAMPTQNDMDNIMDEARRAFGLAQAPRASRSTAARFAGSGPRASAPPQPQNGGNFSMKMTKQDKKMARAAFPGIPEAKAFQKYMNLHKDA